MRQCTRNTLRDLVRVRCSTFRRSSNRTRSSSSILGLSLHRPGFKSREGPQFHFQFQVSASPVVMCVLVRGFPVCAQLLFHLLAGPATGGGGGGGKPSMRKRLRCFCTLATVFWASDDGRHHLTYAFVSHGGLFLWPLTMEQGSGASDDFVPLSALSVWCLDASWRSFVARDRGHRNAAARTYCACGQDFVHPNRSVLASSVSLQSMSGPPHMLWCLGPVKNRSLHCRGRVVIQFVTDRPAAPSSPMASHFGGRPCRP